MFSQNEKNTTGNHVAESIGTTIYSNASDVLYDIENWPGLPLVGPSTLDEANIRLDEAEKDMDNNQGFSWNQVMHEAKVIVDKYGTSIY